MKQYLSFLFSFAFLLSIIISPLTSSARPAPLCPSGYTFNYDLTSTGNNCVLNESSCIDLKYNLRLGNRDIYTKGEVSILQKYLAREGYLDSESTGYFGLLTVKAVAEFQKANNISPALGYSGAYTRAKIKALTCGVVSSPEIKVISPNGGENWKAGDTAIITWTTKNAPTDSWVALFLQNKEEHTQLLTQKLAVNGSYDYLVSETFCAGDACYPGKIDGDFKIIAHLYTGSQELCGGFCYYEPGTRIEPVLIKEDSSDQSFKITSVQGNCFNGIQDFGETGIDVGGPCGDLPCPVGTTGTYPVCVVDPVVVTPDVTILSPNGGESYQPNEYIPIKIKTSLPVIDNSSYVMEVRLAYFPKNQTQPVFVEFRTNSGQKEIDHSNLVSNVVPWHGGSFSEESTDKVTYKLPKKLSNFESNLAIKLPSRVLVNASTGDIIYNTGINSKNSPLEDDHKLEPVWYGKNFKVYATIKNTNQNTTLVEDSSDTNFSIIPEGFVEGCNSTLSFSSLSGKPCPSITLTYPKGGEKWKVGSNQEITWTTKNAPIGSKVGLRTFSIFERSELPLNGSHSIIVPETTCWGIPSCFHESTLNKEFEIEAYLYMGNYLPPTDVANDPSYLSNIFNKLDFDAKKISVVSDVETSCPGGYTGTYPNCVQNPVFSCIDLSYNLKLTDRDANRNGEVTKLQNFLVSKGYLKENPTGYFGAATLAGVIKFQRDNNISPAVGLVGPLTRANIKDLSCNNNTKTPEIKLISPNGGEVWEINMRGIEGGPFEINKNDFKRISWTIKNVVDPDAWVNISLDGVGTISAEKANKGYYDFLVSPTTGSLHHNIGGDAPFNHIKNIVADNHKIKLSLYTGDGFLPGLVQAYPGYKEPKLIAEDVSDRSFKITCPAGYIANPLLPVTISAIDGIAPVACILDNTQTTKPTVTITSNPTGVEQGKNTTLTWSSTNVTSCTAKGGWAGAKSLNGSEIIPNLQTTTTFTLICTGSNGEQVSKSVDVGVYIVDDFKPSITILSPNGGEIFNPGEEINVKWESKNLGNYDIRVGLTYFYTEGGSKYVESLTKWNIPNTGTTTIKIPSTEELKKLNLYSNKFQIVLIVNEPKNEGLNTPTYILDTTDKPFTINIPCNAGQTGTYPNCVTTVTPKPTVTITASPSTVPFGGQTALTWSSTNATSCTASGGWTGAKAISGFQVISNLQTTTTFTLTCTGANGGASKSVDVGVYIVDDFGQPEVSLTLSKNKIKPGESITVSWNSKNVTNCKANGAYFEGNKVLEGSEVVKNIATSSVFSLVCESALGKIEDSETLWLYAQDNTTLLPHVTLKNDLSTPSQTFIAPSVGGIKDASTLVYNFRLESTQTKSVTIKEINFSISGNYNGVSSIRVGNESVQLTSSSAYSGIRLSNLNLTIPPGEQGLDVPVYVSYPSIDSSKGVYSGIQSNTYITSIKSTDDTLINVFSTGSIVMRVVGCTKDQTGTYPNCVTTVTPKPTVTITASPSTVPFGGQTALTWSSTNATSCTASNAWSGAKNTSGTVSFGIYVNSTDTYTLTCTGPGGTTSASTTILVASDNNTGYPIGCTSGVGYSPITGQACTVDTSSLDKTPRIARWTGKAPQYVNSQGVWTSDPATTTVSPQQLLSYCKKWYPTTTSATSYKNEPISSWINLSTGAEETFFGTSPSYQCVGGVQSTVLGVTTNIETPSNSCSISQTLMKGMNNSEVKCLQQKLNQKGYKVIGTEGGKEVTQFGLGTLSALKKFQVESGLKADGILGLQTRTLLNK